MELERYGRGREIICAVGILPPAAHLAPPKGVSRSMDDFTVVWDAPSGDSTQWLTTLLVSSQGACTLRANVRPLDNGAYTFARGSLVPEPIDADLCLLTVTLSRHATGLIEAGLAAGSRMTIVRADARYVTSDR